MGRIKYKINWRDQFSGDAFKIEFFKISASPIGIPTPLDHPNIEDAFVLTYNKEDWVSGFEGVVSFTAAMTDVPTYDSEFLQSDYRDYRVSFYINNVLKNVGWLKPENTTREYIGPGQVSYNLSFTDGLNDLSSIDFDGFETAGRASFIQILADVLNFNGIATLPVKVQCNITEDILGTQWYSAEVDYAAFYKDTSGDVKADSCFTVLEKILKSFYCTLSQVDGFWHIVCKEEIVSDTIIFTYGSTSPGSPVSLDRRVDISTLQVPAESKWDYTKTQPLKTLSVTWRNKDYTNKAGTTDFNNGSTTGAGPWDIFAGGGPIVVTETIAPGDPNIVKVISSNLFTIGADGDVVVSFRMTFNLLTYYSGSLSTDPPSIQIRLRNATTAINTDSPTYIITTLSTTTRGFTFPAVSAGNYNLEIRFIPPGPGILHNIKITLDTVSTNTPPGFFDKLYRVQSNVDGYVAREEEVFFMGAPEVFLNFSPSAGTLVPGLGVISEGTDLTSEWSRNGASGEGLFLIEVFIQLLLADYLNFFDLITIQVFDLDESINYYSILELGGKTYRFDDYSKNYSTKLISGTIKQISPTHVVSYTAKSVVNLTTQMGQ